MKNIHIKISRIFLNTKEVIREQLVRLDNEKSLSSLFSRFAHKIISLSLRTNKNITSRIRLYHKFGRYLFFMNKRHGSTYVVKYLKACKLAVSKVIANQPFTSLREIEPDLPLPRLSSGGLPVLIGTRDRRSIVQGSTKVIRMYLSLFSLYRIIVIESKSKLNTITDAYSGNELYLKMLGSWFRSNTKSVIGGFNEKPNISAHRFLFRETASPSSSKSWSGAIVDAALIYHNKQMFAHFSDYCKATNSTILELISKIGEVVTLTDILNCFPNLKRSFRSSMEENNNNGPIGQLSTKAEPAGKLRVFAIVDSWTQSLFSPLHRSLFDILKRMPNDGTFDQTAAFERACAKATKNNCCYGYDLSAATDRLPIELQVQILAALFGDVMAKAWRDILVERDYFLYEEETSAAEKFRYAVGQPMGALSSWAMLAITHHMIMQYCSKMINPSMGTWETNYEVLGDDIVIFSKDLANKYLEVMSLIGVPINESKSIVSVDRPVVEFAKRTWWNQECSPIPFKQLISQDTFKGRINTALGLFLKEKSFLDRPLAVFETILSKSLWDKRPKKDAVALLALMNAYFEKAFNIDYLLRFVRSSEPIVTKGKMLFANFKFELSRNIVASILKDRKLPAIGKKDGNYLLFEFAVRETIRCRLINMLTKYTDDWVERQVIKHLKVFFADLPKSKTVQISHLTRNLLFNQRINYLTQWNMSILNDPKIPIQVLTNLLNSKMNDLSGFTYVDRLLDPSSKLPSIEIDTCSILQLVAKGFAEEAKYSKDPSTFDLARFISFVRYSTNYKDLSKIKGFELVEELRGAKY